MKLRGNMLGLSAMALAFALSSCAKGPLAGGKSDDSDSSGGGGEDTTAVAMQGTLALATTTEEEGAALGLVEDPYNLYCVTFTDVPLACKIDVGGDGAFSKECADFASKAFGCFLRQGNKTLATIEFDLGSALTVGGGALVFSVSYDPVTGLAFAKIDSAASTSLGGAGGGGEATTIALDGTWQLGCPTGGDTEIGDCAGKIPPEGFPMTFSTFKVGDQDKLTMWGSTERQAVCLAGGSEAMPNFRIALGGKDFKMDYASKETFEASVDALFVGMPSDIKTEVVRYAKSRSHTEFCSNKPTADNCKLFVPEMVTKEVIDPATGKVRTESRPKDYNDSDFDGITEFTGTGTASEWKCALDPAKVAPGIPPCGGNMQDPDGDGLSGGTNYVADNKPLMLLCKNDMGLMQFPVLAATKAAAVTAATSNSGPGSDCAKVSIAGTSEKYFRSEVEEIRRATYELFMVEDRGGPKGGEGAESICSRSEVPDDFKFSSCSQDSDKEVCYMKDRLQQYGLKVGTGKLVSNLQSNPMYDDRAGDLVCPTASAALKASKDPNAHQVFGNACRNEILGMSSLVAQLRALMKGQALYRPMSESIICGRSEDDALRKKLLDSVKNSCLAQVEYNKMCFEGGVCETTMSCRGSVNNGKCMSDDGTLFTGRVNGRDELMDLKMMTSGAFSMSSSSLQKYYRWNQESNKPVSCTFAKSFIINARKVDDNTFTGVVSQAGTQSCDEGSDEGGSKLALQQEGPGGPGPGPGGEGGGGGGGEGGGGGGDEGGPFTIPIQAVRK